MFNKIFWATMQVLCLIAITAFFIFPEKVTIHLIGIWQVATLSILFGMERRREDGE